MRRAGPVRRAGSFNRDPGTSEKKTKNQVCDKMISGPAPLAGIPTLRYWAEIFPCNRVNRDSSAL